MNEPQAPPIATSPMTLIEQAHAAAQRDLEEHTREVNRLVAALVAARDARNCAADALAACSRALAPKRTRKTKEVTP